MNEQIQETAKPSVCLCPDDCNCHAPWRTNYCGCRAHTEVVATCPICKHVNDHALSCPNPLVSLVL